MATKIITMYRVPYAQKDSKMEDREYQINIGGPVGTMKEIVMYVLIPHGWDKALLKDIDGVYELSVDNTWKKISDKPGIITSRVNTH